MSITVLQQRGHLEKKNAVHEHKSNEIMSTLTIINIITPFRNGVDTLWITVSTFLQDHLPSSLIRNQTLWWKPQNMLAWSLAVQVSTLSSCILLLYQFLERNKKFLLVHLCFLFFRHYTYAPDNQSNHERSKGWDRVLLTFCKPSEQSFFLLL